MSRTVVGLIVAAAVLAGALWWLPSQRPFHGTPRAQARFVPELPDGLTHAELIAGFEALGTTRAPESPAVKADLEMVRQRYAAALQQAFLSSPASDLNGQIELTGHALGLSALTESSPQRLYLLLRTRQRPTRDLALFVHCVAIDESRALLPEYWRPHGLIPLSLSFPTPTSTIQAGAFVALSAELPRLEGRFTLRIGLMDERAALVGTAIDLRIVHLGSEGAAQVDPGEPYSAWIGAAIDSDSVRAQSVLAPVGVTTDARAELPADRDSWDHVEIGAWQGEPRPARVIARLYDEHSTTETAGRITAEQPLRISRAGTPFENPIKRWRLISGALALLAAVLAFGAVYPSRLARAARVAVLFLFYFALARIILREPVENATQWNVILASDALGAGIFTLLTLAAAGLIGALRRREITRPIFTGVLWVALATPLTLWFVGEWPGHLQSDQAQLVKVVSERLTEPWLSTLHGLYANFIARLFGNVTAIAPVNIALVSGVLARLLGFFRSRGMALWLVVLFAAIFMTSIPLAFLAIHLSHDALAGFLKIAIVGLLFTGLVKARLSGSPGFPGRTIALIAALALTASLLRGENLALLLFIPLILLVTGAATRLQGACVALALVAGTATYRLAIEPAIIDPGTRQWGYKERYQVTLLINPLNFMVHNRYYTATPEEDRAAISDILGWDRFVSTATPFEIPYFWTNVKGRVTAEQVARLRRVYVRAVLNNPALFVGNRVTTFAGCLGGRSPWYPFFSFRETTDDRRLYGELDEVVRSRALTFERENPGALSRVTHTIREWASPHQGPEKIGYYLWNAWPALAVLVVVILAARRLPITAAAAGVIGVPLVLFIAATPASHFKYITDLYLFGFVGLACAIFEARPLRRLLAERSTAAV